jgi:hypothetical protein
MFFTSCVKTISHSFAALTCEILFLPLEHKIHISSQPSNILYIFHLTSENYITFLKRSHATCLQLELYCVNQAHTLTQLNYRVYKKKLNRFEIALNFAKQLLVSSFIYIHRRPRLDLPAPACAFLITREGRKH